MTPYEVRLEVLKLVEGLLNNPIHSKRSALIDEYHAMREIDPNIKFPTLPDFPTTEDIIAEAEKLNKFISNG